MPLTVHRSYPTGRTSVLRASGNVTLHYCGGKSVDLDTPPPGSLTGSGWQGSNWFHPTDNDLATNHFHQVASGCLNGGVQIKTGYGYYPYNDSGGEPAWVTRIDPLYGTLLHGDPLPFPTPLRVWYQSDSRDDGPAESITVSWSIEVSVEEWAYECDWFGIARPSWTGDGDLYVRHKPTSTVKLSANGTAFEYDCPVVLTGPFVGTLEAGNAPDDGDASNSYTIYAQGAYQEPYPTDMPGLMGDGGATYAEAGGFATSFPVRGWWGNTGTFDHPNPAHPVLVSSFRFFTSSPSRPVYDDPYVTQQVTMVPDTGITIQPAFRDWDHATLSGVPIYTKGPFGLTPNNRVVFGGAQKIQSPIQPLFENAWLTLQGYNIVANTPYLRWGPTYPALTIGRASSLEVLDFTATPPTGYDWVPVDCGTPTVSGGALVVSATGSDPSLYRSLKSDLADILASPGTGPGSWYADNHANPALPSWFSEWWTGQATPPGYWQRSPGLVERIGRRLLPTSDRTNWSSWRFARIRAKADAACAITLRLWMTGFERGGIHHQTLLDHVDYEVSLTDTMADHTIDLPGGIVLADGSDVLAVMGHYGLRYVGRVEILFPTGRTLSLESITLYGKGNPTIDVHSPGTDIASDSGMIAAYGDGKLCLHLGTGSPALPDLNSSLWGWPVKKLESGTYAASQLIQEVVWDILLQEGWTATPGSAGPDALDPHGAQSFATWLMEAFGQPPGQPLMARKSYRSVTVYPGFPDPLTLELNLGHGTNALTYSRTTGQPIAAQVTLETPTGDTYAALADIAAQTEIAHGFSDARGIVSLADKGAVTLDLRAYPSPPGLPIDPPPYEPGDWFVDSWPGTPRTIWPAAVGGAPNTDATGGGTVVLDIDQLNNRNLTYVPPSGDNANNVTYARERGIEVAWEEFPLAVARDPWIHVSEVTSTGRIYIAFCWGGTADNLSIAYSDANGTEGWRMAGWGTGTKPFLRIDKSTGRKYLTYWRSNNVYLRICEPFTETPGDEIGPILSGVDENVYTFDWERDNSHTLLMVYWDGAALTSIVSTDNGETWAPA